MVPVGKPKSSIRICTNFRDLNAKCPKDDFPLSNIDPLFASQSIKSHYNIILILSVHKLFLLINFKYILIKESDL